VQPTVSTDGIAQTSPRADAHSQEPLEQRNRLIVDPKEEKISGIDVAPIPLTGVFYGSRQDTQHNKDLEVQIGHLSTDSKGRLVFLGGAGYSRSVSDPNKPNFQPDVISEFDSIDWIDDVCDGWVDVIVLRKGMGGVGVLKPKYKATVSSAPPNFSYGINCPTSLYDIIENLAVENHMVWRNDKVQFYEHIWPVLSCTYGISWVNEEGYQGHGPAGKGNFLLLEEALATPGKTDEERRERKVLRDFIFQRLRKPNFEDPTQATTKFMPRLSGDNGDALEPAAKLRTGPPIERFAALTKLQYSRFQSWRDGDYQSNQPFWKRGDGRAYQTLEEAPLQIRPWLQTLAALEHSIGDPLYPGIEMYHLAKDRHPKELQVYKFVKEPSTIPPFHVNHDAILPGHLTRGLSLPWQCDFYECNTHWWPSARPDDVINILDWPGNPPDWRSVSEDTFLQQVASRRQKWDRALRVTPDHPSEFFPGSTDMIRFWNKLGFVRKQTFHVLHKPGVVFPVFLEQERLKVENTKPGFTLPRIS